MWVRWRWATFDLAVDGETYEVTLSGPWWTPLRLVFWLRRRRYVRAVRAGGLPPARALR